MYLQVYMFHYFPRKMFFYLNYQIFTPESKEAKCSALIEFWKFKKKVLGGGKSNVRVSSLVEGTFIKKIRYWFVLEIRPRQIADVCISCLNNGVLRHWLDFQNKCVLDILKTSS